MARTINAAGAIGGEYSKHDASGAFIGNRPVRWNAEGVPTELGTLGTSFGGSAEGSVYALNGTGVAVGSAEKYDSFHTDLGKRAVRWSATGTAATELGTIGTSRTGFTSCGAYFVNAAGTAIGYGRKYDAAGNNLGDRAIRWNAGTSVATELEALGTASDGTNQARAFAINDAGTAVGQSVKYLASHALVGHQAIKWEANSAAAIELSSLDRAGLRNDFSAAYAINNAGSIVGACNMHNATFDGLENHAVFWTPDNTIVDLNSLGVVANPPTGTWLLSSAESLSEDGWVAGKGYFTPYGGTRFYSRWVGQVGLGGDWLNTTSAVNNWGKGRNWSTGTPAIQLDANFNSPSTYAVAFDDDEQARRVSIVAGDVAFDLAGHSLTIANGLSIATGATLSADGTIVGDLTNVGTLSFSIASASDVDHLHLTGLFTAGGTIAVELLAGYTPSPGNTFDLLDFSSLVDNGYQFDFTHAPLPTGLTWDTSAFAASGAISVVPEPFALTVLVGVLLPRRRTRR